MTENELINLGFEKVVVSPEESGSDNEYYYYTLDIGKVGFITNANDEMVNGEWVCYLFDYSTFIINDAKDLEQLLMLFKKYTHVATK